MPSQTRDERTIAQAAAQVAAVGETVEVLALTGDEGLLATLRQAVGANQRVWHATDGDQAIDLIMAGRVGVIVVDTLVTGAESAAFCEQLRSQFPDLVLMVAGGVDEQTHLVKQITAGDIYRFLHKPVSTARARQFIEAAVRRHLEGRTFTPAETAQPARIASPKVLVGLGAGALALVAAAVGAFLFFSGEDTRHRQASSGVPAETAVTSPSPETELPAQTRASETVTATQTRPDEGAVERALVAPSAADAGPIAELLAKAREALAQGQLVTPPGASAFDLYRDVLARDAGNGAAQAGLDRVADQLLGNAESALLEERIDDAGRDIEAARTVRPNNMRLAFLSAQYAKERERRLIALAREAAAKGNHDRARTLIERAMQNQRTPSPVLAEARKDIDQFRRGDSVENLLRLASERLKQNRLVEPANDNARSYIEAALAADPGNVSAQQARRALADQLLARGRQAISARDPVAAGSWLSQAEAMNADRAALRAAQRDLQNLRQTSARGDQISRLAGLLNERLGQDRVLEPAGDSATHYWQELRAIDASNAALPPALQNIGVRLMQQSRQAIEARRLEEAQHALAEARLLGYSSAEFSALERDLAARERNSLLTDIVPANQIVRDKQVAPRYPTSAERKGIEGWVELDFTIAMDGAVKDVIVRDAAPVGVFEDAAIKAISQWQYRPVMRNGRAIEQRARLRLRFDVPD